MTLRVLLLLMLSVALPVRLAAQAPDAGPPPVVDAADVLGLPRDQLTPDLQRAIDALAGAPLDRDRVSELLTRIESEIGGTTAAVREVVQPDGRIRITLVVMRAGADDEPANVNRRYTVGRVSVDGIDEAVLSQDLRDALQAIVGRTLEEGETDALERQIEAEVADHEVVRTRLSRGDGQGQVHVTFVVRRTEASRWVPFAPTLSKLVYHRRQGWSGVFDIPVGLRHNRFTLGLVRGNADDRVEEYSGYSLRVETREVGTRRLGLSLEFARYTPTWRDSTLDALAGDPDAPALYGRRTTITPSVTVALTRDFRVTSGVAATDLAPHVDSATVLVNPPVRSTAAFAQIAFLRRLRREGGLSHNVSAGYEWQGGRPSLGSDLRFDRHVGSIVYNLAGRDSRLTVRAEAGHLAGHAPLFARFTLGDTRSLRGWDKYDIAPAGGDRMFHQSVEYAYKSFVYFVDGGSVWDVGMDRRVRVSTGVGFDTGYGFLTVGVPLNGDKVGGVLMLGFRSSIHFGHERMP
jgi:hypothetical protein